LIAFTIPFSMFGLFVLSIALGMMRGKWTASSGR